MSDNDDNDDIDTVLEHNLDDSISVNQLRQKLISAQILGCTIIIIMTIIINNYL